MMPLEGPNINKLRRDMFSASRVISEDAIIFCDYIDFDCILPVWTVKPANDTLPLLLVTSIVSV